MSTVEAPSALCVQAPKKQQARKTNHILPKEKKNISSMQSEFDQRSCLTRKIWHCYSFFGRFQEYSIKLQFSN